MAGDFKISAIIGGLHDQIRTHGTERTDITPMLMPTPSTIIK